MAYRSDYTIPSPLSREDRAAIQAGRLAAKRAAPSPYPTVYDVTHRKSAYCRRRVFENMNFVAKTRMALLRGEFDGLGDILDAKTAILTALQIARRDAESAKYCGCALYRF